MTKRANGETKQSRSIDLKYLERDLRYVAEFENGKRIMANGKRSIKYGFPSGNNSKSSTFYDL